VKSVIDFINGLTNEKIEYARSAEIINQVCIKLGTQFGSITPRLLGYLVWDYINQTRYHMPN
jgi:hypothetical protein